MAYNKASNNEAPEFIEKVVYHLIELVGNVDEDEE